MYCVVVGDIIRSKSLDFASREDDTFVIEKILQQVNSKYASNIFASFGIVRGDAFEGVLFSQQCVPKIIQEIIKAFYRERKLKIRVSAVMDDLSSVSLDRNKSDGPAFHHAIQEIEKMKEEKSDHWFQVSIITNTIAQPLVNSLMNLLRVITEDWTDKQREIVWLMSDVSNQKKLVSEKLNISATVVNKQLKAANYEAYKEAWLNLETFLINSEEESIKPSKNNISYTTYYSIGLHKNEVCDYEEAVKYFNKSIELVKNEFGERDFRLVSIYNCLVQAYLEQLSCDNISKSKRERLQKKAEKEIKNSISCQEDKPKMRLVYAQTLNLLGIYYLEVNDYIHALKYFENAKNIIQEIYGFDHPLLPVYDNNIAIAYKYQKKYDKALFYYQSSLNAAKKDAEYNPMSYADSLYNIGLCYEEMGNFGAALDNIENSLELLLSHLPARHENIIEQQEAIKRIKAEAKM